MKEYDVSQRYYAQILTGKPTIHDYLNAGHVELCMGNKSEAIAYYKKAVYTDNDFELFTLLFDADKDSLIDHGVDKNIFPFLFDQIKYGMI